MDDTLIWSNEHRAWWRPHRCGYTVEIAEAGRYAMADAQKIAADALYGRRSGEPVPEIAINFREIVERIEDGSYTSSADMPAIMVLLGYECIEHQRLGIACRKFGESHWQSVPQLDANGAALYLDPSLTGGHFHDIGLNDDGTWYVGFNHPQRGNDYANSKRMSLAMWGSFVCLMGMVERADG